jgi:HEAT repeat protein
LILDRACFGDPGEIMRNLCHAVEAIVNPEWSKLIEPCVAALKSSRPGTRLWAAHVLQRLRDPSALPALQAAAQDKIKAVRERVEAAIKSTLKES